MSSNPDEPVVGLAVVDPDDRYGMGCHHVPERYWGKFEEDFDTSVGTAAKMGLEAVQALLHGNAEAVSLLLTGPVGSGKTLLAAIAANHGAYWSRNQLRTAEILLGEKRAEAEAATLQGRQTASYLESMKAVTSAQRLVDRVCPRWVSVSRLFGRLRREMHQDDRPAQAELESIQASRALLIIDDLGAEKASDWSLEILFDLVSSRYDEEAQLLITSNLSVRQLTSAGYGRIVSRMADDGILLDMATAKDYRLRKRRSVA